MEIRKAGPNEKRCIVRHHLRLYSNLVVGAIYAIPQDLAKAEQLDQLDLYVSALRSCLAKHPFLSLAIQDADSSNPVWIRPEHVDLRNHFRSISLEDLHLTAAASRDIEESAVLSRAIEKIQNDPEHQFVKVEAQPAWALVAVRLPDDHKSQCSRVFLAFSYSHSHGDGMSGVSLQQTLYESLQKSLPGAVGAQDENLVIPTPQLPVPEDVSATMPISLSYLLYPLLRAILPRFLARLFRITGNLTGSNEETWKGSKMFIDDTGAPQLQARTNVEILHLHPNELGLLLSLCKMNKATLTPLLNYLISTAVSSALLAAGDPIAIDQRINFVAQVPINLRKAAGVSDNAMGNFVSSASLRYGFDAETKTGGLTINEELWATLRTQRDTLSKSASTLSNQPVGLLRYVSDMRAWMQNNIGQARDTSWEVSNLGSINPATTVESSGDDEKGRPVRMEQTIFAQPASPIGPPMFFNVIGLKAGGVNISITWQTGALGLAAAHEGAPIEQQDRMFVRQVIAILHERIRAIIQDS